jgi:hypothetical protein
MLIVYVKFRKSFAMTGIMCSLLKERIWYIKQSNLQFQLKTWSQFSFAILNWQVSAYLLKFINRIEVF